MELEYLLLLFKFFAVINYHLKQVKFFSILLILMMVCWAVGGAGPGLSLPQLQR